MIMRIGMQPKPFRLIRPSRAQRPVEQERSKPSSLECPNQPEMNQFDFWLADAVELAETGGFAIDTQHTDMCRGAGEQRFEISLGHAQALIPLNWASDDAL